MRISDHDHPLQPQSKQSFDLGKLEFFKLRLGCPVQLGLKSYTSCENRHFDSSPYFDTFPIGSQGVVQTPLRCALDVLRLCDILRFGYAQPLLVLGPGRFDVSHSLWLVLRCV